MATTVENRQKIFDSLTELKDAGLVAASGAAQVSGSAQVIDIGEGHIEGKLVIDVTAIEVDTGDELYEIALQGTNTAAFGGTDIVDLVIVRLGDAAVLPGGSDLGVDRYVVNWINQFGSTLYKYLRLYHTIAGTIATGINYSAFLSK